MKLAIQIPVKARSSLRCPGKNFRKLGGVPLWERCALKAFEVKRLLQVNNARFEEEQLEDWEDFVVNVDIFLDSESALRVYRDRESDGLDGMKLHHRDESFAEDWANGNHLLNQFAVHHPHYDAYCQMFVTAPFLKAESIVDGFNELQGIHQANRNRSVDSVWSAQHCRKMLWHNGAPVTSDPYRMDGELRTQSMDVKCQTHGFYWTRGWVALRTGCRIGAFSLPHVVSDLEAFDIDTEADWVEAERLWTEMNPVAKANPIKPYDPPTELPYER